MPRSRPYLSASAQRELDRLDHPEVVVAAVRTVTGDDVAALADLGVRFVDGTIVTDGPPPPPRSRGRVAVRNLDGWDEKLRDGPKEPRTISSWAPSWNESGWHSVSRTVMAWPVRHHPARLLTISATVLEKLRDGALIRFRVDRPLHRADRDFDVEAAFCLSLLREAVGDARFYQADLDVAEYLRLQHVSWELLPPGSGPQVLARIAGSPSATPDRIRVATERLTVLDKLRPTSYIVGTAKFARYFGVRFDDRLVALENLEYGNALYVFEQDWEQLTQLSRSELMSRRDPSVHRVPHVEGWQSVIRRLLRRSQARRPNVSFAHRLQPTSLA